MQQAYTVFFGHIGPRQWGLGLINIDIEAVLAGMAIVELVPWRPWCPGWPWCPGLQGGHGGHLDNNGRHFSS